MLDNGGRQLDDDTIIGVHGNRFERQPDGTFKQTRRATVEEINSSGVEIPRFIPDAPATISDAHSIDKIGANTRFGGGNRNSPKTVGEGGVDLTSDLAEINSGAARLLPNGDLLTSSGRTFGRHTDGRAGVFPKEGPGLVNLSQAEFGFLTQAFGQGGITPGIQQIGARAAGNQGLGAGGLDRITRLFDSKG